MLTWKLDRPACALLRVTQRVFVTDVTKATIIIIIIEYTYCLCLEYQFSTTNIVPLSGRSEGFNWSPAPNRLLELRLKRKWSHSQSHVYNIRSLSCGCVARQCFWNIHSRILCLICEVFSRTLRIIKLDQRWWKCILCLHQLRRSAIKRTPDQRVSIKRCSSIENDARQSWVFRGGFRNGVSQMTSDVRLEQCRSPFL